MKRTKPQAKQEPIDIEKISPELIAKCDGPDQFARFNALVGRIMAVPHAEILRREKEYKKLSDSNPHRRGPKRSAASHGPVDQPHA